MIRYSLACSNGHGFEAWFRSAVDFDGQAARGLLSCPTCGDGSVEKALMAPSVRTTKGRSATVPDEAAAVATVPAVPPVAAAKPATAAMLPPEAAEMIARLREIKKTLLENSEDVGQGFVEEARRIHYGEAPMRAVHGQASPEDARSLIEEGVEILPLPVLPEERN